MGGMAGGWGSSSGAAVEEGPWSLLHLLSLMIYLIQPHVFKDHLGAHDSQTSSPISDLSTKIQTRVSNCLGDVSTWIPTKNLKLNVPKRECLMPPRLFNPNLFLSFFLISGTDTTSSGLLGPGN